MKKLFENVEGNHFKLNDNGVEPYDAETDTVAAGPRDRMEEPINKIRPEDEKVLAWATKRLSREGNPDNRDALEKVIKMIKSGK